MLACTEARTVLADESIGRISNLKIPEYITYIMACWVWDNLLMGVKFLFELDSVFKDMSTMRKGRHIFSYIQMYDKTYLDREEPTYGAKIIVGN
jgi:hypothetical protein